MTDIHSHLLPGVDDGVQTIEATIDILIRLKEAGVERLYFTPHIMMDYPSNNRHNLLRSFKQLKEEIPHEIEVKLAAEYMLDAGFTSHFEDKLLSFSSNHVLVETSYMGPPPDLTGMLYEITIEGYIPVIAHPERYAYMSTGYYAHLKEKGYKFQMNLLSLTGFYGVRVMKNASYLLKRGMYDYIGSDIHSWNKYYVGLKRLNLSAFEQKEIKKLIHNNSSLW